MRYMQFTRTRTFWVIVAAVFALCMTMSAVHRSEKEMIYTILAFAMFSIGTLTCSLGLQLADFFQKEVAAGTPLGQKFETEFEKMYRERPFMRLIIALSTARSKRGS